MSHSNEKENHFTADDGISIFYRQCPAAHETARLVIAHGLGEHSGRFRHVIDRLHNAGISVWAMDHRGHGKSGGKRGHIDSFDQYLKDLKQMVDIAGERKPPAMKLFLLGHSMGGLIVLRFVETFSTLANGVIASSPGLKPGMKVPVVKGTLAKIISRIKPGLSFDNELDSSFLSHDRQVVEAYDSDLLVHRNITARWFTEFLAAMEKTRQSAADIRIPVLMQVAGDDRLVDAEASRQFYNALTASDKTLFFYDTLYHEIYNEKTEDQEKVLSDLDQWLLDRI